MTFSALQVEAVRRAEVEKIASLISPKARILEIGAGTGQQAQQLSARGHDVIAIEVANSPYTNRVFPVTKYDGANIPLPDKSVDVVFSSNVLEHVKNLTGLHDEIRRVLRPDGYCIHVMPTHIWRFWSLVLAYPDAAFYLARNAGQLLPHGWPTGAELNRLREAWSGAARACANLMPLRHGERGNAFSELWLFHPRWWRRHFCANGFDILRDEPMGLFYTGNMFLGTRLSVNWREQIAQFFGSACHLFKVAPAGS